MSDPIVCFGVTAVRNTADDRKCVRSHFFRDVRISGMAIHHADDCDVITKRFERFQDLREFEIRAFLCRHVKVLVGAVLRAACSPCTTSIHVSRLLGDAAVRLNRV